MSAWRWPACERQRLGPGLHWRPVALHLSSAQVTSGTLSPESARPGSLVPEPRGCFPRPEAVLKACIRGCPWLIGTGNAVAASGPPDNPGSAHNPLRGTSCPYLLWVGRPWVLSVGEGQRGPWGEKQAYRLHLTWPLQASGQSLGLNHRGAIRMSETNQLGKAKGGPKDPRSRWGRSTQHRPPSG